jgi:cytochrome d ubiquinol oxidase subunit II
MSLQILWFIIITVFWTGFFILEGFDFGVGALHQVVGHNDVERRVAINTIGPTWDGNEVWLIVAGASTFAAFPGWYATWFSSLYLALLLVLVSLIIRGVSFEFRGKSQDPRWRATWSWTLTIGSVLVPLFVGVGMGDLLVGLPIDQTQEYTGTFWNLLTPYGVAFGVTLLVLCLFHGLSFLALKSGQPIRSRAHSLTLHMRWVALILVILVGAWTYSLSTKNLLVLLLVLVAVIGAAAAAVSVGSEREGLAFTSTAVTVGATVGSIFAGLYPNVMISSTDAAYNLTLANTSSQQYALQIMSIVALVMFPIVLLYQAWTYYIFRRRVITPTQELVG